jgi:NAD(P)-dependent dehydrogenase (short-subunit alcohol dehydrogenase family)
VLDDPNRRQFGEGLGKLIPLGRAAEPYDIASAVLYLVSDLSGYITGHTLVVDGGWSA